MRKCLVWIYVEMDVTGAIARVVVDPEQNRVGVTYGYQKGRQFIPIKDEFFPLSAVRAIYHPQRGWNKKALAWLLE